MSVEMALQRLLPMHPEHYTTPQSLDGILEVIGGHVARVRIITTDRVPEGCWIMGMRSIYPKKKSAISHHDDGTVLFYVLYEFRDAESGCAIIVRLFVS